jgi:hypothetical protein
MLRPLCASILALCAIVPSIAAADGYAGGPASLRRIVLYRSQAELDFDLHLNLSDNSAGEPIALSPSFYYGFTNRFTAGIAHNIYPHLGIFGGRGFTFNAPEGTDVYNNLSLDFLYLLSPGRTVSLAFHGGLDFLSFDPFSLHVRGGLRGRIGADRFALIFDPSISVGDSDNPYVEDVFLDVPAWLMFQASHQFAVGAVIGFDTDFDNANLFLGFTFLYTPNPNVDLGLLFTFPAIDETADLRSLTFTLAFRL